MIGMTRRRGRSRIWAILESIDNHRKRRRQEEEEEEEEEAERYRMMMMEEEEEEWLEECQLVLRKRNTGMRPGGTNTTGRVKYDDSVWGRMLRDPQLSVAGSPAQKIFMRRFRVPHPIFLKLVEWAKGWHEKTPTEACKRPRCPTDLKVLGWLRMVGRAACFDDVEELSGIKPPTMNAFFHQFSEMGHEHLYPAHVSMPSTLEEITEIDNP